MVWPRAKVICDCLYCLVRCEYTLLPRQSKIPRRTSADTVAIFTIFHFHDPVWRLEITGQLFSLIQAFCSIFQKPLQFYVLSVSLVRLATIITPLLPHLAQISGQWMGRIIPELTWLLLQHMEFLNPLSDFSIALTQVLMGVFWLLSPHCCKSDPRSLSCCCCDRYRLIFLNYGGKSSAFYEMRNPPKKLTISFGSGCYYIAGFNSPRIIHLLV